MEPSIGAGGELLPSRRASIKHTAETVTVSEGALVLSMKLFLVLSFHEEFLFLLFLGNGVLFFNIFLLLYGSF